MRTRILEELLDTVRENGYHERSKELFAGAGIIVCNRKTFGYDSDIFVISKHAAEISSIIFRLRDLCQEKLDYLNKYEFYGRLAKNANNYIENHGDDLGVISSIIEEAIRIMYFTGL